MSKESKYRALIIEDDKAIANVYDLKFRGAGFETIVIHDGSAATKALDSGKFDVIILDLIMPGLNGFQVLEQLKGKGNKVPVIVSSNLGQEEDKKRTKELGAADYIVKTEVTPAELVEKVKKFLR